MVKRIRGHHLEARMRGTLCKATKTTQPTHQIKKSNDKLGRSRKAKDKRAAAAGVNLAGGAIYCKNKKMGW